MHRRHPDRLPTLWLMTDARQGDALWPALARLPRGSGIVFRHLDLALAARQVLFQRMRRIATARGHLLLWAGPGAPTDADGSYAVPGRGLRAYPVHSRPEIVAAERAGADLLFVSPIYPTRTHPGARALGRLRFGLLAQTTKRPVIALGGMTAKRWPGVHSVGAHGWAAIDGLTIRT